MVAKTIARKKNRESDTVEQREFSIQNIIDQTEVIGIIKCYEEIIKTANKSQ